MSGRDPSGTETRPWAAHLPKVLLVLGLMAVWEVAVRFLRWELLDRAALLHHFHCLSCWTLEAVLPYLTWAALAALPVWASWRWRLDRRPSWRAAVGHLLFLLLHVTIFLLVSLSLYGFAQHHLPAPTFLDQVLLGFGTLTLEKGVYWTWNCVLNYSYLALASHVLDLHAEARDRALRASRAEARLAEAQLQTLRSQIQPHFLFNALANIHAAIAVDDAGAKRMVNLLSDFLRKSLVGAGAQTVSLREELEFVDLYLQIQQLRFSNRLRVVRDVDPLCLELEVPHLILQPLVENAVKHGIAPRVDPGTVRISAARREGGLELRVQDDGTPHDAASTSSPSNGESTGLGLRNVAERLRQRYGRAASSLAYGTRPEGGWEVRVLLPARPVGVAVAPGPGERA